MTQLEFQCPSCQATGIDIERSGTYHNSSGLVQRLLCKRCGCDFTDRTSFEKMKTNARTVLAALDLYFRGLSYRKIAEHLCEIYGVHMTHVAVFNWIKKYMRILRRYVKQIRPVPGKKWHCDEMKYSINGNSQYLWNLMDSKTRFLLACQVTQRRRKVEAKKELTHGVRTAGAIPAAVVTDGLASYSEAVHSLRDQSNERIQHVTRAGENNKEERLNQTLRERTRTMRVNDRKVLRRFAGEYPLYYNFFRKHSALGRTPAQAAKVAFAKGWLSSIRKAGLGDQTKK
jgi:transposase-like protein